MKSRVTFIQRILPHYRIPFFLQLRKTLEQRHIELRLIYGQEYPNTVPRTFPIEEPWADKVKNRYYKVASKELVWQPCLGKTGNSDLVIIEQSSRLLVNYFFLSKFIARRSSIAFWGHGKNLQANRKSAWYERIKEKQVSKVDWWFAYTQLSADIVAACGVRAANITVVQNAIDSRRIESALNRCTDAEVENLRARMNMVSKNIGLYCGGMYEAKKLEFLIRACALIREKVPDFEMIFVGDGPDQHLIETAVRLNSWMHYVGPKFDDSLAPYYKMSKAVLMPGLVGLAIIDSFIAEVPMFTTDIPIHSPEIAYMEHNVNGIMTRHAEDIYAGAVVDYLKNIDSPAAVALREGCRKSAKIFTLENMVENFAEGIERCLRLRH